MKIPFLVILGWCLGACASAQPDAGARGDTTAAAAGAQPDAADAARTGPVDAAAGAAAAAGGATPQHADPVARLWTDAAARERFAASYLGETDVEPGLPPGERGAVERAMGELAAGRADAALQILLAARGSGAGGGSALLDFLIGNVHYQQDRLADAAAAYDAAVLKFPRFRRAWVNLGQARYRTQAWDQAARALVKVLELGGGDALTCGLLGVAHSRRQDHVAAESAFRRALMLEPGTLEWRVGLADSLFRQERFGEAIALLDRLIVEHPDRAELWLEQGKALARTGQTLQAAANLAMVDRLQTASATTLNDMGDLYANEGLYDLAVEAWLRALQRDPGLSPGRALRAAMFLNQKGVRAELRALLTGLEQMRGAALAVEERKQVLHLRARLILAEGGGEEERRVLEQVVALDPLDGDALLQLGRHFARTGDAERAVLNYERAAAIESCEADARVYHAQLLVGQRRYGEALPLLKRAQTLKPREAVAEYLAQVERAAQSRN